MKKFLAVCATAMLITTFGLAQGPSPRPLSNNQTQYEHVPRHDYGWIGLLGLLGLGGLALRHDPANRGFMESSNIDSSVMFPGAHAQTVDLTSPGYETVRGKGVGVLLACGV